MKLLTVVVVAVLAGCAVSQSSPEPVVYRPTPVCTNQQQCEAMWAAAGDAIEMTSRMRIRYQTDTVIDTFAPFRNMVALHGRVTKRPVPGGGYEIEPQFDCKPTLCDLVPRATSLFNLTVTSAGRSFATQPYPARPK